MKGSWHFLKTFQNIYNFVLYSKALAMLNLQLFTY